MKYAVNVCCTMLGFVVLWMRSWTSIVDNHVVLGKGNEVCLENPSSCANCDPLTCSLGL